MNMEKVQKELLKSYYHSRTIAARENYDYNFYRPYEITKEAITNNWLDMSILTDDDVSHAIIKDPELVHPLGLRELDHGEYTTGYALLAVVANSNTWHDLGDIVEAINKYNIKLTMFFTDWFNPNASYKEKGLNFLISLVDDVKLKGVLDNRPELLDNPVILKNVMERSWYEISHIVMAHKPELISKYGKTFEDLDNNLLIRIANNNPEYEEQLIPLIKEKLSKSKNYSPETMEQVLDIVLHSRSTKPFSVTEIINEEITLFELRHVKTPTKSNWMNSDLTTDTPLKDNETIRVYHGFNKINEAVETAKYGLTGKERVSRRYSYESVNNPKGLFVSVQFDTVKREFSNGVVMEFSSKVSDLEAPVWHGGGSYFVQGDYTSGFENDEERNQQQLKNREKHAASEYPAIANSDRPELAWALYDGPERQALFVGDLNPNMIQAFWVNEIWITKNLTNGPWERVSRKEFLKRYGDIEGSNTYEKKNKVFKPADDFTVEGLKAYLDDAGYSYDDFVEYYIKGKDEYALQSHFYPKQIAQIKKIYGV